MCVEELVFKFLDFFMQLFDLVSQYGVIGDEIIALDVHGGKLGLQIYKAFVAHVEQLPHLDAESGAQGGDRFDARTFLLVNGGIKHSFNCILG